VIPAEIRCSAPHPTAFGLSCNARLYDAVPGTLDVRLRENGVPPGCLRLKCRRCGTEYVVCPANHPSTAHQS
jgi:hypothetical protein